MIGVLLFLFFLLGVFTGFGFASGDSSETQTLKRRITKLEDARSEDFRRQLHRDYLDAMARQAGRK